MFNPKYSNYDKYPFKEFPSLGSFVFDGYDSICYELSNSIKKMQATKDKIIVSLDYYPGVTKKTLEEIATQLSSSYIFDMDECAKSEEELENEFQEFITDDRVFGIMCHKPIEAFYDYSKLNILRERISQINSGLIIVIGFGVNIVCTPDISIYAGITRWEIQLRFRRGACNFNRTDSSLPILSKYKRGFFIEWRIADKYKYKYFNSFDYFLDSEEDANPKLLSSTAYKQALETFVNEPFRMEPYFDPGVWGGHWMQDNFDLDKSQPNYAWSFDGVPEENSINIKIKDTILKFPALDVVYYSPIKLLGDRVHARFGKEFPIRFDMLDTMGGENLSLQVHPLTEYIQNTFGMHYTQDESYYILDTVDENDAYVYLGVKENVNQTAFISELRKAEKGEISFPAEKYVNKVPVKKHDHVLIPAGTIHCSGKNVMVLEISATPYIFTFKLWDWDRLGLDGLPRPIHVEHGKENIIWNRDTTFVYNNLIHQEETIDEDDSILIEKTGLHEREFIKTIRYSLRRAYEIQMEDTVHMMNLVSGSACRIKSPTNAFSPFEVHFAETAIVPANVNSYILEPVNDNEEIKMIVASIK